MFNGSALKIAFLMIVFTMCLIVVSLVLGVVFFKFPVDDTKMMLGMLGISALFGVIVQSFVHANIADALKTPPAGNAMSTQTTTQIQTAPTDTPTPPKPTPSGASVAQITPTTEVKP